MSGSGSGFGFVSVSVITIRAAYFVVLVAFAFVRATVGNCVLVFGLSCGSLRLSHAVSKVKRDVSIMASVLV